MHHLSEWSAISNHIRSLGKAAEIHARFTAIQNSDSFGRINRIGDDCLKILDRLKTFRNQHSGSLPPAVLSRIDNFISIEEPILGSTSKGGRPIIHAVLVLTVLEADISYLLNDQQQELRSTAELAFAHLQRTLVPLVVLSRWALKWARSSAA